MSGTSTADVALNWERFYQNYRRPDYIPGYEIVNKLGSGVFGSVFKARKTSIGKFYAIKFLKVDDEATKNAIVRELESLRFFAQIDHPNLVSIEDKGEVDGIPFIIMGYAGEETLRRRLEEGRLPEETALAIFHQLCDGVAALHEKSIVHFDLKPSNVFLKGGIARVGDYGLSRLMSESHKTLSMGRGTPYYMAPEMLRKKGDRRSDIYSLGVILFECLVGEVPFKGDSEWEVLKKHETESLRFPDSVSPPHRAVISRSMAKDPEERYASVGDLLAELGTPRPTRAISEPSTRRPESRPHDVVPDMGSAVSEILRGLAMFLARARASLKTQLKRRPGSPRAVEAEPVPEVPDHGLVGNVFHIIGRTIEVVVLAALVPLKYLPWVLGKTFAFLLMLPFRLLAIGLKLFVVLVLFGVILFFLRVLFGAVMGVTLFR